MSEPRLIARPVIRVNADRFAPVHGETIAELVSRVEDVLRAGGGFVELTTPDGRPVHVLVTTATQVVIGTEPSSPPSSVGVDQGAPFDAAPEFDFDYGDY